MAGSRISDKFCVVLAVGYGDVDWSVDSTGTAAGDSLVTGSRLFLKPECAFNISSTLGRNRIDWLEARQKVGEAYEQCRSALIEPGKAKLVTHGLVLPVLTELCRT